MTGDEIPPPSRSGEEIIAEVERLKREPARFQCLGMSFTMLAAIALVALLLWLLLRSR